MNLLFHIHLGHFTFGRWSTKGDDLSSLQKVRYKICGSEAFQPQRSSPVLKSQGYLSCIPVTGHNLTVKSRAWCRISARELR